MIDPRMERIYSKSRCRDSLHPSAKSVPPRFCGQTINLARQAMNAAIHGGFRIVEFTLSIPGAFELIEEFVTRDGLVVGAGTVLTVDDAERREAGAVPGISGRGRSRNRQAAALHVAVMPGCCSPTEMLRAHRAGAPLQKLFPEQSIGPRWVKQTLGPLPFLKIVPTSGSDAGKCRGLLAGRIVCRGVC